MGCPKHVYMPRQPLHFLPVGFELDALIALCVSYFVGLRIQVMLNAGGKYYNQTPNIWSFWIYSPI